MRGTYYYHPDDYEGTQYQFNTEKYFINTPFRQIINYLGDGKTTTTSKTNGGDPVSFSVNLCNILEETRVGSNYASILRLVMSSTDICSTAL